MFPKIRILTLILLSVMIGMLISCSSSTEPVEVPIEEKIGQMLLIGFRGISISDSNQIAKDIKNGRVGGVVLFDVDVALGYTQRNIVSPSQVKELISSLQSFAKIPLFVGVDQEGGKVARLKEKYGFPHNVSQQYLGNLNNQDSTRYYAGVTAQTLNEVGFNLNFAPVVDLNVNPDNPVIGKIERSFSADASIVVNNSVWVIEEHHNRNIKCTMKHFPGHGSSTSDSHQGLTDVTKTWSEIELKPYQDIIEMGKADFIMTAHIFNSNLDADYPATLSKNIITGILRNQLKFDGVIVSDDMNMKAITDYYGLSNAIELSINAGVDILVFGNNLIYDEMIATKAIDIIKKLIDDGKISKERIDESYQRIMKMKSNLFNILI